MTLSWLPLTTLGFMVGDYISTSIVPGDDDATPVFEVANAPTTLPNSPKWLKMKLKMIVSEITTHSGPVQHSQHLIDKG